MLRLIDSYEWIRTKNFEPATRAILGATNARYLIQGEWLQLDANYRMARGGNNAGDMTDEATVPSWPYFGDRGRTDTQATANGLIPMLWLLSFEARTTVCSTAGGAGMALGSPVAVYDLLEAATGIIRRGLGVQNAGLTVGYVTRINDTNDINFVRTLT